MTSRQEVTAAVALVAVPAAVWFGVMGWPEAVDGRSFPASQPPAAESVADTVLVPWPVAEGGVTYRVMEDGVEISRHTALHTALRAAGERKALHPGARVAVEHDQVYRVETRAVVMPVVTQVDSAVVLPRELEMEGGDRAQYVVLGYVGSTPYACSETRQGVGMIEVEVEEDGDSAAVYVVPGGRWLPGACGPETTSGPMHPFSGLLVTAGPTGEAPDA